MSSIPPFAVATLLIVATACGGNTAQTPDDGAGRDDTASQTQGEPAASSMPGTTAAGGRATTIEDTTSARTTSAEKPAESSSASEPDAPAADARPLESLGRLHLGQTDAVVIDILGSQPATRSSFELWGADGLEHQTWSYPSLGLELGMVKDDDGKIYLESITAMQQSRLTTTKGIGIGSTRDQVMEAYKSQLAPADESAGGESVVVGSVYGGIIFDFEGDRVSRMFVGAAAE